MAQRLFHNIGNLIQVENGSRPYLRGSEINKLPVIEQAFLVEENGHIKQIGNGPNPDQDLFDEVIDCQGATVLPSFVDSHSHLVYAANREDEFAMRLAGKSYAEIAEAGGGILNSAAKLAASSEESLYTAAKARLEELISYGTGALEIKSGYGLSTEAEIKMLRVVKRLKEEMDLPIKATFLGAHAFPPQYKNEPQAYIDLIINEMLPQIAEEGLADYVDAFCEKGYFDLNQTLAIVEAAKAYGLEAKVHVNQFNSIGAVKALVDRGALSLDHLEVMTEEDLNVLAESNTIATVLPGCSLFLDIPFAPAKELIDRNAIVAIATDMNPGSAPSGNMAMMMSLACTRMKLNIDQALCGVSLNGAAALEISEKVGSLELSKEANFIILKPGYSLASLAYHFGHQLIWKHIIRGKTRYEAS